MKSLNTFGVRFQQSLLATSVVFIVLFSTIMPVVASAAEVSASSSAQTVQLLPPNVGNICPQMATPIFKAYVYDNAVNSFDVTIADPSYVAIAGSVGETQIPFNYITRFVDASGILHMHVDTPTVSMHKAAPVTLTLLSVRQDKTVCAATISATLPGSGAPAPESPSYSPSSSPSSSSSDHQSAGTGTYTHPKGTEGNTDTGKPVVTGGNLTDHATKESVIAATGMKNTLAKVCATTSGATRLWTVLLAIYLLIVAATILAQPTTKASDQSSVLLGAAIIIPLLALFGVWGTAAECRIGMWAPVAAIFIAAVGFALGFRRHPQFSKTSTPVQPSKPTPPPATKTIITPPPKTPPPPKNDKDK